MSNNKKIRNAPPAVPGARSAPRSSLPFEIPFDIPNFSMDEAMDDFLGNDVADEDLEAELEALMSGKQATARPQRPQGSPSRAPPPSAGPPRGQPAPPPRKSAVGGKTTATATTTTTGNAKLKAPGLLDFDLSAIERIGEDDGDDGDESVDEDDPELLAELHGLSPDEDDGGAHHQAPLSPTKQNTGPAARSGTTPVTTPILRQLQERLQNYEGARHDAIDAKDAGKVRRYDRAIKTLKEQLVQAKKGETVAEDDIPPPILTKSANSLKPIGESTAFPSDSRLAQHSAESVRPTPAPAAAEAPAAVADVVVQKPTVIRSTSQERNIDRLRHRRDEYRQAALHAKKADNKRDAMRFMNVAKQFDTVISAAESGQDVDLSEMPPPPDQLPLEADEESSPPKKSADAVPPKVSPKAGKADETDDIPEIDPSEVKATFGAPEPPKTILEALQQRFQKYKATAEEAQTAGDSAKARRMQRIVKQYQEAIKDFQAKRPVDFDELPTPPGFGPIPTGRPSAPVTAAAHHPAPPPGTVRPAPAAGGSTLPKAQGLPSTRESRQEQQYHLLVDRQKQFKLAALKAKKEGAMETAKLYLRQAKGLEQMIAASANGIPVDVATIPKPPPGAATQSDDFEVVQYEDAGAQRPASVPRNRKEVYEQLEHDLVEQVKMCVRNEAHFKKAGDIPMSEKFERFNQQSRKDLESLRNAFKHSLPVPKFHYETRVFSVVKCCPELPENVMELSIIRGFGYTLPGFAPSDFTTYVKWDFPLPAETPQSGKTNSVRGNEPDYSVANSVFPITINRKSRSLARIFKAKGIKCEVYVKMGFLKADKVLGTVTISLESLETKCVHHSSIDLLEGKKAVGGKLEVKVRVREPIIRQQVEELKEQWLVIDQFVR